MKSAYVVSAETTLKPGPPPSPQVPRLAVWPGMDTAGGLIQPIIVSTTQREYPYVLREFFVLQLKIDGFRGLFSGNMRLKTDAECEG